MAKRRRQYGTGSVYQRESDGRWYGTIEAGYTKAGTRRRINATAGSEAECKRKLRDKRLEIEREGLPTTSRRVTVKQWADEWLDIIAVKLRPKTFAGYSSAVRSHIVTTIGAIPLAALTPTDIRAVGKKQRDEGLSSSTLLHTHVVLTKMLRAAHLDGHPVPPRVLVVERPVIATHDREGLTVDEALAVLRVAFELRHFSRWYVALMFGMRQGECLGLTWDQVDFDAGAVHVSWQLQALPYLDRAADTFRIPDGYESRRLVGGLHLVRPKSAKGKRTIPLVGGLWPAMESWRVMAPESPHGLVWPRADGKKPADVKKDLEEWKALQCTAGVGHPAGRYYLLHEARNTAATMLMEAKVSNEVITAVLGHSSIVVSRGYMHVSQDQAREAMERVAARLEIAP